MPHSSLSYAARTVDLSLLVRVFSPTKATAIGYWVFPAANGPTVRNLRPLVNKVMTPVIKAHAKVLQFKDLGGRDAYKR